MKFICTFIMIFFLWLVIAIGSFFCSDSGYSKEIKRYTSLLGDTVIINNKSYIITDFSFVNSSFLLDNGSSVYQDEIVKYLKK